jgi:hypothetical protein
MSSCNTSSSASLAAWTTTRVPLCLYNVTPLYDNENLPDKASDDEKAPYYDQELEARALIQLTLFDKPLSGVLNVMDTKETWHWLNSHCKGTSKHAIMYITGELFRSSLGNEKPPEPQLDTFLQNSYILASLGVKLGESLVAVALPLSPPPSYNTIRPILTESTDKRTSSPTKDATLEHKWMHCGASPAIALNIRVGTRKGKETINGSNDRRNNKVTGKCTHCCKRNYEEYESYRKKADEMAAAEKGQDSAEYTADATATVARAEAMLEIAPSSHNKERIQSFIARQPAACRTPARRWLIDSQAPAPMTTHRDLFIAYRSLESPKHVWLVDKCCIYGVGIAQIALDIVSGRATSRLITQDILHVPGLHDSLLSISNLIHYGYVLAFDGTCCTIRSTTSTKNYLTYFGPKHQSKHLAKHFRYFARYFTSKYLR